MKKYSLNILFARLFVDVDSISTLLATKLLIIAQVAERWLLLIQEVHGLNPVIGKTI